MNKSEDTHFENKEILPINIEEISSKLYHFHYMELDIFKKNKEAIGASFIISKMRADFVDKLLLEKDRFSKVFKTSDGSVYFQLETGETFKAKMIRDEDEFGEGNEKHFKFQPLLNNLFFISQNESDRIADIKDNLYPGEKIITTPYSSGVLPLELNIKEHSDQILFKENNGELLLVGIKSNGDTMEIDRNLSSEINIGNPIVEIIV